MSTKLNITNLYYWVACAIFLSLFTACKTKYSNPDSEKHDDSDYISTDSTFQLDPYKREKPVISTEIFDTVVFIPLETSIQSTFGTITKMEITDNFFLIQDDVTNSLLFFEKNGKFLHKISNTNTNFDSTYEKISDFTIDRQNKTVIIRDSYRLKLVFYNFQGIKIGESSFPFSFLSVANIGDGYCYYYRGYFTDTDNSIKPSGIYKNLITTEGLTQIKNRYLTYDTAKIHKLDMYDAPQAFYPNIESLFFSVPFNYNFLELKDGAILRKYNLSLPEKYCLPQGFLYSGKYNGKRIEYLKTHKNSIWNCTDIYRTQNGVFCFRLQSMTNLDNVVLYNPDSKKYIFMDNLASGPSTYRLPIFENRIFGVEGEHLFGAISSKFMFRAFLSIGKPSSISNNQSLTNYFSTGSAMSNPVIVMLKPKNI